jgi:hypothetical protein
MFSMALMDKEEQYAFLMPHDEMYGEGQINQKKSLIHIIGSFEVGYSWTPPFILTSNIAIAQQPLNHSKYAIFSVLL